MAIWFRIAEYTGNFFVEWLILFLIVKISSNTLNEQFDKVCKKKFLNYLDEEHIQREVTIKERDAARENMDKFIMRQEADEKRGVRRSSSIITDGMIAIFMTFLTYGQNKRRNFL